jgi:hypothetical protein
MNSAIGTGVSVRLVRRCVPWAVVLIGVACVFVLAIRNWPESSLRCAAGRCQFG